MQTVISYEINHVVKTGKFDHALATSTVPTATGVKRVFRGVVLRNVGNGGSILDNWELENNATIAGEVLECLEKQD